MTRVPGPGAARSEAKWCTAEPGPTAREAVPAQQCTATHVVLRAALRPGHDSIVYHDAFLILKLFRYSSGLAGSKFLPITEKLLVVVVGGVSPASFINRVASVAR